MHYVTYNKICGIIVQNYDAAYLISTLFFQQRLNMFLEFRNIFRRRLPNNFVIHRVIVMRKQVTHPFDRSPWRTARQAVGLHERVRQMFCEFTGLHHRHRTRIPKDRISHELVFTSMKAVECHLNFFAILLNVFENLPIFPFKLHKRAPHLSPAPAGTPDCPAISSQYLLPSVMHR